STGGDLRWPHSKGRKGWRITCRAADQVRSSDQLANRQDARSRNPDLTAHPRRRSDRVGAPAALCTPLAALPVRPLLPAPRQTPLKDRGYGVPAGTAGPLAPWALLEAEARAPPLGWQVVSGVQASCASRGSSRRGVNCHFTQVLPR